jgi:acetyl esterase/lipase
MHPDRFFYPELPANPPKDVDWSNRGKGAILPYADALKKAGNKVKLRRYAGVVHGFVSLAPVIDQGKTAIRELAEELKASLR